MASVYARGKIRWVKFYPPGCSQPSRQSLGEVDPALAELILRKLELELQLRGPDRRLTCRSGKGEHQQRGRICNPLAYAFTGSNPVLPILSKKGCRVG